MWNQLKFGAWSSSLSLPAMNWWAGWNSAGLRASDRQLPITIRKGDRWTDFFFGKAETAHHHSLLDSREKVALHYCALDIEQIAKMSCPSAEIPSHLWQQLRQQSRLSSRYSLMSRRFHE
ncbi:MAG: hypothetical protein WA902_03880 [Thermosynechococcaceae cyanobacterium]